MGRIGPFVFVAGVEGIDPPLTVLETVALPLHHTPRVQRYDNTPLNRFQSELFRAVIFFRTIESAVIQSINPQ